MPKLNPDTHGMALPAVMRSANRKLKYTVPYRKNGTSEMDSTPALGRVNTSSKLPAGGARRRENNKAQDTAIIGHSIRRRAVPKRVKCCTITVMKAP